MDQSMQENNHGRYVHMKKNWVEIQYIHLYLWPQLLSILGTSNCANLDALSTPFYHSHSTLHTERSPSSNSPYHCILISSAVTTSSESMTIHFFKLKQLCLGLGKNCDLQMSKFEIFKKCTMFFSPIFGQLQFQKISSFKILNPETFRGKNGEKLPKQNSAFYSSSFYLLCPFKSDSIRTLFINASLDSGYR